MKKNKLIIFVNCLAIVRQLYYLYIIKKDKKNFTMETTFKYFAKIHARPNTDDPKFIGTVSENSIKDLKEAARKHGRGWNERGRLHLECENTGREFYVNA